MPGAINFAMADVYGVGWSTTEETIPEAADQQALVDDQKAATETGKTAKKSFPIALGIVLVLIVAVIFGGAK